MPAAKSGVLQKLLVRRLRREGALSIMAAIRELGYDDPAAARS